MRQKNINYHGLDKILSIQLTIELHVTKKGLKKRSIKIRKGYKMDVKVVCLIIFLTICNANSKPLPNKIIAEQVKQFSEKLHKLKVPKWECSNDCQKFGEMFKRIYETQNNKTLLELATKEPFKRSNSTLSKK